MTNIKPCPRCSNSIMFYKNYQGLGVTTCNGIDIRTVNESLAKVICYNCGFSQYGINESNAIDMWNITSKVAREAKNELSKHTDTERLDWIIKNLNDNRICALIKTDGIDNYHLSIKEYIKMISNKVKPKTRDELNKELSKFSRR